jgi:hypothetical protein
MSFSPKTRDRAWVGTIHITNMEKAGLTREQYENPEFLSDYFTHLWESSGKDRKAGIAVCVSSSGVYHAHIACYGNTTTLKAVSDILFQSHIEPQLGGKKDLTSYLLKEGKYAEKGEQVLCTKGLEIIEDRQGNRNDLEDIAELLKQGYTPAEIMETNFSYRRYEKIIKSAFIDIRIKETPLIKETHNEWHVGSSGSGKTFYYFQLCEKYSSDKIYITTDFENGGFDFYIEQGAPPILFLDEFKGNMKFSQLLTILDKYSRTQTHCRYANTYNLWTTCIITSIFPPEELYASMVANDMQKRDKLEQLLRRLDKIVYHYVKDGEYKSFSIPASEYTNYENLKQRALADNDGFVPIPTKQVIPLSI